MSDSLRQIDNTKLAVSVMKSMLVTAPVVLLVVPSVEVIEDQMCWSGKCEFRAKGVPAGPEGRTFLVTVLRSLAEHLNNYD